MQAFAVDRHQYWEVVDMKIAKKNLAADIWEDMK